MEEPSCYYEVLGQTHIITVLDLTVSQCDRQDTILGNHFLLGTAQPEDVVESNCKELFYLFIDFFMNSPLWYTVPQHTACYDFLALLFIIT